MNRADGSWAAAGFKDTLLRCKMIDTEQDGLFNCMALLDAASRSIRGTEFISATSPEPSPLEVRRLIKKAKNHKNRLPTTLVLAREVAGDKMAKEAERQKIDVVRVPEGELLGFIGEARHGFRQRLGTGAQ